MNRALLLQALAAALAVPGITNQPELLKAGEAMQAGSPIAGVRVKRALSNALAHGRADLLNDDLRDLCMEVIGGVSDRGGVLPGGDGKLSHVHLRVEARRKSAYVRAAQSNGESLSEWITRHCDREAGHQP